MLGLNPNRAPTREEIAHLLNGSRTDGAAIAGKQVQSATRSLAEILSLDAARVPTVDELDHVLAGRRADGSTLEEERLGAAARRLLELYGVSGREASAEELVQVRDGRRADGNELRLGPLLEGLSASRARIGYVDLCWSADKSVSVAWAFAPTEAERNMIAQAHRDAVDAALAYVEAEIGRARKGKAGRDGFEPGQIAWVRFDHYASRPTVEVARTDPATGAGYTELVTLKVAGDPQLHTHVAVPNVVFTESGRVGGLDLKRLDGRVHEFGAVYQGYIANNLRRGGAEVALDEATGAARLVAIPERVREAFSKRTRNGTEAARAYARELGLDWDSLDAERKIGFAKSGIQGDPRQVKQDDLSDWASWQRQARGLGWSPASVLDPARTQELAPREKRLEVAYAVARRMLDRAWQRRAVLGEADVRVAAARGLVASGIAGPAEIGAVTRAFAERGVRHDGKDVGLIWGLDVDTRGESVVKLTTTLHAEREAELIELARDAAADRSAALSAASIAAAVARSDLDFSSAHGMQQRAVMEQLGQGGRLAVAIGVAGSGKSAVLAPLVDAWRQEGRQVYGAALAWRQTDDLAGAGIGAADRAAMSVFLERVRSGWLKPDRHSVVVVDELGLLGTRQLLDLLQLQKRHGFQVVAVGDPRQCQSIEAGPVIDLLRRALGPDVAPELLTTLRQQTERERETSLMLREGQAAEALARKREDGTAQLVPGGAREAAEHVAALWQARRAANAHDPDYTLTVSAPTNAEARAVASAIRERRQAAGELGPDQVVLDACDQNGVAYALPLAIGDRVRLFDRVNAACADKSRGLIGNNGSVLEVRELSGQGITLRNTQCREGLVRWDTLRDPSVTNEAGVGRIRLSYGDVLSIDATQGVTSTEHIEAMPSGTRGVNAYKAYTQGSRHRRSTFLVTSDGAERQEVAARRALGDPRPIREADVWANMARNLARAPEKASALEFLERARELRRGTVRAMQAGLQVVEQRHTEGQEPTLARSLQEKREREQAAKVKASMREVVHRQSKLLKRLRDVLPAVHRTVEQVLETARPMLRQVTRRWRQRWELEVQRARLLEHRMNTWRQSERSGPGTTETVQEASKRLRDEIASFKPPELRAQITEAERENARQHQRPMQSPRGRRSLFPGM